MLLQVTQHTDSLDRLTQSWGQHPIAPFILIAVIAIVATIIILPVLRQASKKPPKPTIIKQTNRKKEPIKESKSAKQSNPKETQSTKDVETKQGEKPLTEKANSIKTILEPERHNDSEPPPEEQSQPKNIGYNPINIFEQTEPYNFPYVIMPRPGCIIKFPRKGRKGRKGFKEDEFLTYLTKYFSNAFKIYDDRFITVRGHRRPYEPDITFTDEKNGINIFLDIEIDEPYEGINDKASRKATHFQYADTNRNNAFKNRGWIVIRFAEIQVHQEPLQCCTFIADVIKSIHSQFDIPYALLNTPKVTTVKQWTKEEAEQWSMEMYREKYLNLPKGFGYVPETENLKEVQETDLGNLIEDQVKDEPSFIVPKTYAVVSNNPKRDLIESAIESHKYLTFVYDGNSTIIEPLRFNNEKKLLGFCYIKNCEREFELYQMNSLKEKSQLYTSQLTDKNIDVEKVKELIKTAINYNKYLRIRYTRGAWTDMITGEVKEAKKSLRTISGIAHSIDVLEEEQVNNYNLNNEEHLNAFCNRDDVRKNFRFDRINEVAVLNL